MPDTQRIWIMGEGKNPFVFDGVIGEDHSSETVITTNPVETGVPMSDHAYETGDRLEIEAGVGDVWVGMRDPQNLSGAVSEGLDSEVLAGDVSRIVDDAKTDVAWLRGEGGGDTSTRSQRAYQLLRGLKRSREPFGVQTGLLFYPQMMIERLTAHQDKDTSAVLYFRATLVEVLRFGTETVTFPPRKAGKAKRQASKKADGGEKKSQAVTETEKAWSALGSAIGDKVKAARDGIMSAVGLGGP